jgi:hypothetical protein
MPADINTPMSDINGVPNLEQKEISGDLKISIFISIGLKIYSW